MENNDNLKENKHSKKIYINKKINSKNVDDNYDSLKMKYQLLMNNYTMLKSENEKISEEYKIKNKKIIELEKNINNYENKI